MKKIVSLAVCVLLAVCMFAGCAAEESTPSESAQTSESPAAESASSEPAESASESASEAPAEESEAAESAASNADHPDVTVDDNTVLDYDLAGKKIGVSFYDLTNPVWAATAEAIQREGEALGAEISIVSCEQNAATQVTDIENMIQAGCDLIIIGPQDANALDQVIQQCKDNGIMTIAYGQSMPNCDAEYTVKNYDAGLLVGLAAGEWITEHLGGEAEVGMLDFPTMADIIDRANGIKDGLAENAPNAQIVATQASADAVTGMDAVENMLQANPDMKVVVCIGDGGAIGANEAVKAAGKQSDDFGIFSCDGTAEALSAMMNGDPIRMTVGLGTPNQKGKQMIDLAGRMLTGQEYWNVYTPMDPVSIENAQEYWELAGY